MDESVSVGCLLQRKTSGDDRLEASGLELQEKELHRVRQLTSFVPEMREVQSEHTAILVHQRKRPEGRHLHDRAGRAPPAASLSRGHRRHAVEDQSTERCEQTIAGLEVL